MKEISLNTQNKNYIIKNVIAFDKNGNFDPLFPDCYRQREELKTIFDTSYFSFEYTTPIIEIDDVLKTKRELKNFKNLDYFIFEKSLYINKELIDIEEEEKEEITRDYIYIKANKKITFKTSRIKHCYKITTPQYHSEYPSKAESTIYSIEDAIKVDEEKINKFNSLHCNLEEVNHLKEHIKNLKELLNKNIKCVTMQRIVKKDPFIVINYTKETKKTIYRKKIEAINEYITKQDSHYKNFYIDKLLEILKIDLDGFIKENDLKIEE